MKQPTTRIGRTSVGGHRAAPRRSRRRVAGILVWPLLVWAVVASWFAYAGHTETERLAAEQAAQKATYEDKVRALTRRLVGVASHQMLEQDGLAGRMADIVTRQVELENRVATLASYAERIAEPGRGGAPPQVPSAAPAAEAILSEPAPAKPASDPGVLRLGGSRSLQPQPSPAVGPRSALDGKEDGVLPKRSGRIERLLALPTRAQFDALEASLAGVEGKQPVILGNFMQAVRDSVSTVRAILGSLGVTLSVPAATAALAPAGSLRDPFEIGQRGLDAALEDRRRWRSAADSVPLRRPIEGAERNLTSNFGTRKDPFTGAATMHAGMDFRAPTGTQVRAAAAGRVITAETSGGYGNLIEIDHGNGVVTRYGHLSAYIATAGQMVQPDTVIGLVGSTGRSTGPHLHYETRVHSAAVDPLRFLKAGSELFDRERSAGSDGLGIVAAESPED
ncbi:M23 family metallopeptidase [Methylorubrum aminovorans]